VSGRLVYPPPSNWLAETAARTGSRLLGVWRRAAAMKSLYRVVRRAGLTRAFCSQCESWSIEFRQGAGPHPHVSHFAYSDSYHAAGRPISTTRAHAGGASGR
jgi:hypothetical protein